ncbi:MAG: CDP-alcohol phosphatidyltransferase family protein [Betaproteobacteria bacterium]|nr:MAG: CDP-alcohol phosphatidyltransferase family protein [Betaproteobacteria bacterium]
MLDRFALPLFSLPLHGAARLCRRVGLSANAVTLAGLVVGLAGAALIATGFYGAGLALVLANRFLDGVDGTMARMAGPTDRGGFLDIVCDFLFYAAVPLAFAYANPVENALAAATLLAAFIGTGSSFLAFAAITAKRGQTSPIYPNKAFYYLGGLTEGTETIVAFCVMCLSPTQFATVAYVFAAMCAVTIVTRVVFGARALG